MSTYNFNNNKFYDKSVFGDNITLSIDDMEKLLEEVEKINHALLKEGQKIDDILLSLESEIKHRNEGNIKKLIQSYRTFFREVAVNFSANYLANLVQ